MGIHFNERVILMNKFILISMLAFSTLMAGCSSSEENSTGSLSLRLTDAPIDGAEEVVVQFSAVELRGADASQNLDFTFDTPKSINLLSLQGDATEDFLTDETVPAGVYNEIRLLVDAETGTRDTYIVLSDFSEHEMTVPSGSSSGLKVKGPFTVPPNGVSGFTIDFDVRKSIVKSGNANSANGIKYHLKPVLRIVDNNEVGIIAGTVDAALLTDATCSDADPETFNSVYVFEGSGVVADDIDSDPVEPITTALVNFNLTDGVYEYKAAFMAAGEYTVALTCNSDLEDIESDEDLLFTGTQDATVTANTTFNASF
jgi:hypothetical protein